MTGQLAEARPVQTESRRGALPLLSVGVCADWPGRRPSAAS
jgi:hypothetical protein